MKSTWLQQILQNILENETFQRIAKFIMLHCCEMDFMKGIFTFAKVDEMYNILMFASYCLFVDRLSWNWISFCCSLPLNIYYVPPLLRDRVHPVRDTAVEKQFDVAIQMTLEFVTSEIQEKRNVRKKLLTKACKCYKASNFF